MDTESRCSGRKGTILDAVNSAFGVANVCFAAFCFRTFGVSGSGKIRASFSKQSHPLFLLGLLGRDFAETVLPNFLSGFFRSDISAVGSQHVSMPSRHMFGRGKTFQIFNAIVSFVTVDVVNVFGKVKTFQPASRDHTVHESFSPQGQIAVSALFWGKGGVLSKNFSAPRDSVEMVECSIFDAVYNEADHGEPFWVIAGNHGLT